MKGPDPSAPGGGSWEVYDRPTTDEIRREPGDETAPAPAAEPPDGPRPRRRLLAAAVAAGAVTAGGLVFALVGGEDAPPPYPPEENPGPIMTADVWAEISGELERAAGDTRVRDAWIDGTDDVQLIVPSPGDLDDVYFWDGSALELAASKQPSDEEPFDISQVDPAVLVALDEEARDRSDGDISRSHAHVSRPAYAGDHWVYLKVTEIDHGGVALWSDLDGDVESELINESWRDD